MKEEDKAGWDNKSFKVQATPENRELIKQLEDLARKDGWSFSKLIREALVEYAKRHAPGNPQLALAHWTEDTPMPETLVEKRRLADDRGVAVYQHSQERMAKLNAMSNEALLSRQSKLLNRDGSYLERIEINMVLLARRLGPLDKQMP